ncbi:hypothetical protein [Roseibium marinum]|uniref:Uncharacterized protein n=1 Tax=Roseibium marinum TaxID=281252 RepID=A0A2S3URV0_9HYPH|nr:hypothetical protein [Roseibium marinum]POF30457.1 hypothetical protein CLV41_10670 [Roseibium marinum]
MGKTAKLEFIRRLVPLSLGVLAIIGGFFFMSVLSSLLCLVAAAGIYAALPRPNAPSGAIRPVSRPPVLILDLIGFALGIPLFSLAFIGMGLATGGLALLALFCLAPASASLVFFTAAVRQQTSWVRFFGNGFEFTQLGLRVRVLYEELSRMEVRLWEAPGLVAWFQATIGSSGPRSAVLLNGEQSTKTLVFRRRDGVRFTISSELVPDLQRILIGIDRAGMDLPDGISELQRRKIRQRRERMYGGEVDLPQPSEQKNVARIAALIEHARRTAGQ